MQALADIQTAASFSNDEIVDLSKQRGPLSRNKTGDIMVAIEGKDDCSIGLEVKLDLIPEHQQTRASTAFPAAIFKSPDLGFSKSASYEYVR